MKRSRAPRSLMILLLATGLLGLALYVAYRLATRTPGGLTEGDLDDADQPAGTAAPSADVVDARQPQASAAAPAAAGAAPETDAAAALAGADLDAMSREELYALAEAVGVPARNRLTMTRAQLARTLAEMRDRVAAST